MKTTSITLQKLYTTFRDKSGRNFLCERWLKDFFERRSGFPETIKLKLSKEKHKGSKKIELTMPCAWSVQTNLSWETTYSTLDCYLFKFLENPEVNHTYYLSWERVK